MASSPTESIPSLGEISTETETTNDDGVCRKLFPTPELKQTRKWETLITDIASPFKPAGPEMQESRRVNETDAPGDSFHDQPKPVAADAPSVENIEIEQEEIEKPPAQSKQTSVKQLVGIFSMFEACKPSQWPSTQLQKKQPLKKEEVASQDTEPSIVNFPSIQEEKTMPVDPAEKWKQKAESLERECNALQGIVCADSVSITKLKREVETLQNSNSQHISEISLLSSTLQSTAEKIKSLERAREEQEDLEIARVETIRALKEEIDRLTQTRINEIDSSPPQNITQMELEGFAQMQFEHELFAAQILRDEHAMKEANDALEEKDALIRQLKQRIEVLRARLVSMESLKEKFAALELEKHMMSINYEETLKEKELEIDEQKNMLDEATRVKKTREDEAMNRSRITEIHLVETEQDLETALQLLKEQEEQIWYLEERIVQLTATVKIEDNKEGNSSPTKEPTQPCPKLWCAE